MNKMLRIFKNIICPLGVLILLLYSCGKSPLLGEAHGISPEKAAPDQSDNQVFLIGDVEAKFEWKKGPVIGEESRIRIVITDASGLPAVLDGELKVKLWMPSMGHGSSPVKISKTGEGVYEVSEVYFIMAGEWEIIYQIMENGNLTQEVKWPLILYY